MDLLSAGRRTYRSDAINFLRLFCAIFVVLEHLGWWYEKASQRMPEVFSLHAVPGYLRMFIKAFFCASGEIHPSVVIFIVLSGYCIHRTGLRHGAFDWKTYGIRRFFRVWPLYVVGALLGAGVILFFTREVTGPLLREATISYEITWKLMLQKLTFVAAWLPHKLLIVNYEGNPPLWTVAVEIWLYALYPLGLLFIRRWGNLPFFLLLLANVVIWPIVAQRIAPTDVESFRYSFYGIVAYWWIGAYFVDDTFTAFMRRHLSLLFLSYGVLSLCEFWKPELIWFSILREIIFTLLIGLFIRYLDEKRPDILPGAPEKEADTSLLYMALSRFSESSYSIYVLHSPVSMVCLGMMLPLSVALGATLIISYFSYLLIERPFIQYARTFPKV